MTPQDHQRILAQAGKLSKPLRVQLYQAPTDKTGDLDRFAEALRKDLPQLELRREALTEGQMAYLQIGENLRCAWVPKGEKLGLFLEALAWASGDRSAPALPIDPPDLPAAIRLYLADACPHCHQVLEMLLPLAFVDPLIRLTLIDAQVHEEQSVRDAVRSVPTTLLDDFRWSGTFPRNELLALIRERSPANLGPTAMEMLLANGQAGKLAELMQAEDQIFPAFLEVVTHPLWSVRLGALVVAETLVESAPRLASEMASPLWERCAQLGTAAKGDVIYLLGEIGAVALRDELRTCYERETNPELRDALRETLEKLS
jgi:glutaredoxin